jgi:hypothetical protein
LKPGTETAMRGVIQQMSKFAETLLKNREKEIELQSQEGHMEFPPPNSDLRPSAENQSSSSTHVLNKRKRIYCNLKPDIDHRAELSKKILEMFSIADPDWQNPEVEIHPVSATASKLSFKAKCGFCHELRAVYVMGYSEGKSVCTQYVFFNLSKHIQSSHEAQAKNLSNHSVNFIILLIFLVLRKISKFRSDNERMEIQRIRDNFTQQLKLDNINT